MPLIFTLHWWLLAFLVSSPPLQKFHVVLPTTLALDLCRYFSRWASLACRLHSLFPCLSVALHSKFLDMTINLSLILYTCRFVFIYSLVVSALQDAGGYAISRQNNLELHLGCHTCWWSYFTLVCLWCGGMGARSVYGHVITKIIFSDG